MENRIDRKDDEWLYQPKIQSKSIRTLFSLREETGKPMTVLVDEAMRELAESYRTDNPEESAIQAEREIAWEELCEYRKLLDELNYILCLKRLEKIKGNEK
jgi:hypothetical protein